MSIRVLEPILPTLRNYVTILGRQWSRGPAEGEGVRQLTYVEAGRVEWENVAAPELVDPAAALVRPVAVAL
jgi:hypothetical protein